MKLRRLWLALGLVCALPLTACNYYADASNAVSVIGQIVTVAQSDLPALAAAGLVTTAEATNIGKYLSAAQTLDTQAGSCVNSAHTAGDKTSAFVSCFTAFAISLSDPAELALLRVENPKAQAQVQVWVTAAILAVNGVLTIMKAANVTTPQVAALPTHQELVAFARHAGIDPRFGY